MATPDRRSSTPAARVPGLKALIGDGAGGFHVFLCDRPLPARGSVRVRSRRGQFEFLQWIAAVGAPSDAAGWDVRMRQASAARAGAASGPRADQAARGVIVPIGGSPRTPRGRDPLAPLPRRGQRPVRHDRCEDQRVGTPAGSVRDRGVQPPKPERSLPDRPRDRTVQTKPRSSRRSAGPTSTSLHTPATASERTNCCSNGRAGSPGANTGGFHRWIRQRRGLVSDDDAALAEERLGTRAQPGPRIDLTQVLAYLDGFTGTLQATPPGNGNDAFGQLRGLARQFEEVSGVHMGRGVSRLRAYRSVIDDAHRMRFDGFVEAGRSDRRVIARLFYDWLATGTRRTGHRVSTFGRQKDPDVAGTTPSVGRTRKSPE